ncbi:DUF6344 domain-containing protein [Streptomyces adustus]|uniref:DUF6344 domain-containing protein n=1 Tax=Streptomyces adustus TaxID=1609272 RepID=UPI0037213ADE
MGRNPVMKLWTVIVTAFLALCTALGLVTTTATTAVARTEPIRKSSGNVLGMTVQAPAPWLWSFDRSLPPTMKQRIRAEAHGKSPSCRNRPTADTEAAPPVQSLCEGPEAPDEPPTPLQQ